MIKCETKLAIKTLNSVWINLRSNDILIKSKEKKIVFEAVMLAVISSIPVIMVDIFILHGNGTFLLTLVLMFWLSILHIRLHNKCKKRTQPKAVTND